MKHLDALNTKLKKAITFHNKLHALNEWAWHGWAHDLELAIQYSKNARDLAYKTAQMGKPDLLAIADSLLNTAHLACRKYEFEWVAPLIEDAWAIYLEIEHLEGQLKCRYVLSMLFLHTDRYDQAYQILQEGLDMTINATDVDNMRAYLLMMMGKIHRQMNDYDNALTYFYHSYDLHQRLNNTLDMAECLTKLCATYNLRREYTTALEYGNEALAIARQFNYQQGECETLNQLAITDLGLGDYTGARKRLDATITLSRVINNPFEQCIAYKLIAGLQATDGITMDAENNLFIALEQAKRMKSRQYQAEIHEQLSEVYKAQGNFEQALLHYQHFHNLRDTIYQEDLNKRIQNMVLPNLLEDVKKETELIKEQALVYQERTEALHQRIDELKKVLQVFDEVASNLKVNYVINLTIDAAMRLSGAQVGFIALAEANNTFVIQHVLGLYESDYAKTLQLSSDIMDYISKRQSILLAEGDTRLDGLPYNPTSRTRIIVPLHSHDDLIGILNIETNRPERFNEGVLQLLEVLKGYIAIALDNAYLYEQIETQLHDLQKAHQRVSQLEQLKTDMIRLASHDLRNPLSSLKVYAQLLQKDRYIMTPSQREYLRIIEESVNDMERLISDILSLERIEQMALTGLSQPIDLVNYAQDLVNNLQGGAHQKHQTLMCKLWVENAYILADSSQIVEAMSNLVNNAMKYTPDEGVVTVELNRVNNYIVFTVEDTGYGIPTELQSRLFQPFYRAQSEKTANINGTGLGLHLVKNIIERHQGEVFFNSEYGKGSVFGFKIPVMPS